MYYNCLEPDLVEIALDRSEGTLAIGGAFLVTTGKFTGRSPRDKYIVATSDVNDMIWRENNAEMSQDGFEKLFVDKIAHMSGQSYFVQNLNAGSECALSFNVRVVTELAWHSLFIRHLMCRLELYELNNYVPEYNVINCPSFQCNPGGHGCRSSTMIAINFEKKK